MHPEEVALIADIHADPKNDGPRLLYADWLEDNGAPDYAEFIRLQCEQPYVTISTRDEPRVSSSYEFPRGDQAAKGRLRRLITLYPQLLESERFAPFRQDYHYQEFRRGLAIWDVDAVDFALDTSGRNSLVTDAPPLLRFRLGAEIAAEDVAECLNKSIMQRVDVLRLAVHGERTRYEERADADLILVDFSHLRFLEEINLARCPSPLRERLEAAIKIPDLHCDDDDWG